MTMLFLVLALSGAPNAAAPDVVVVASRDYLDALQPWLEFRARQGHRLEYVSSDQTAEEIRGEIRRVGRQGALRWIVLVGDTPQAGAPGVVPRGRTIPAHLAAAKVNTKWGSEPEIATDNWYADLNDDDVPDAAIGRLTADNPDDLKRIVRKILDYERTADYGLWRHRINFVAGVGGFGGIIDTVLETTTRKFLCDGIPPEYATSMTYGSWRSPYCPDPRRFHEAAVERLNEGCLFWVYIGHGAPTQLDRVQTPGGHFHILGTPDMAKLKGKQGPPIAILLACYTGAFDQPRDCLAEEMLRADGGPVAILAGSRVTMPYAMAVLADGLIDESFRKRRGTIGEVLLHAKLRLMADDPDNENRQLMDAVAAAVSPAPDLLAEERREHLHLFNLIGDPLLGIRHPAELPIEDIADVDAGGTIQVDAHTPVVGRGYVELVCRRDRLTFDPPSRDKFEATSQYLAALHDTYRRANDRSWLAAFVELDARGDFTMPLKIPEQAYGPCHLKIHVQGRNEHALGATSVFVRRYRPAADASRK